MSELSRDAAMSACTTPDEYERQVIAANRRLAELGIVRVDRRRGGRPTLMDHLLALIEDPHR